MCPILVSFELIKHPWEEFASQCTVSLYTDDIVNKFHPLAHYPALL